MDLVPLVLVVVATGLVPVVLMASLFRFIDYLADDDKLEEIRRAGREGRPIDFTGGDASGEQPAERVQATRSDDATAGGTGDAETSSCPNCGGENEGEFDRCWNCQASL